MTGKTITKDDVEKFLKKKEEKSSVMKEILAKDNLRLFNALVPRKTSFGGTLMDCVITGVEIPTSSIGAYATDGDAYEVFKDMFDPIIVHYHHQSPDRADRGDAAKSTEPINNEVWQTAKDYIATSRVRVARNVSGYAFSNIIKPEDRLKLEDSAKKALGTLKGDLAGSYYSMVNLSPENTERFKEKHIYFTNDNHYQEIAGTYREWPQGRGLYLSNDGHTCIWLNEEDHFRVMAIKPGPDLAGAFNLVNEALKTLDKNLGFAKTNRLGYLTCCPTNLGTGMRASVHMRLKHVPKLKHFKEMIKALALQTRGTHGEDTDVVGNLYDISNLRRFGMKEEDVLRQMQMGIETIALLEKSLEAGLSK